MITYAILSLSFAYLDPAMLAFVQTGYYPNTDQQYLALGYQQYAPAPAPKSTGAGAGPLTRTEIEQAQEQARTAANMAALDKLLDKVPGN